MGRRAARRRRRRLVRRLALASAAALMLAGAVAFVVVGSSGGTPPPHLVEVALVDATHSTATVRRDYMEDLETLAERASENRARFFADYFGGEPRTSIFWRARADFATPAAAAGKNESLQQLSVRRRLRELRRQLTGLVQVESRRAGTPIGATLQAAAKLCAAEKAIGPQCRVTIFTDAEFVGEGIDTRKGIRSAARDRFVKEWAPKLEDLDGAEVSFVGVGHGIPDAVPIEDAEQLMNELLGSLGATVTGWSVRLGSQ